LKVNTGHFHNKQAAAKNRHGRLLIDVMAFVCITVLCANTFANGATNNTEYKLKAAYLYQFTKFTQWPDNLFIDKNTPIQICILGRNPFGKSLDGFSGKTSQNRDLTIRHLSSLQKISGCHVVYISRSEDKKLPHILKKIAHSPVLSVSDINNFAERGGIIGFIPKQRKVGIEINVEASRTAGAKISSKLLEIATLVHEVTP